MSDALTDIARDERRATSVRKYYHTLINMLKGEATEDEVREVAESASGGPHGYFSGPVDLTSDLNRIIQGLKNKDRRIWGEVLFKAMGHFYYGRGVYSKEFEDFWKLSPFDSRTIVQVDYGSGFSTTKCYPAGYISENLVNGIIEAKDWVTYDCDDYFIVLEIDTEPAEAYWLGCGAAYGIANENGQMIYHALKRPRLKSDWDGSEEARRRYCL